MSGVGKGVATSSIGTILQARGFRVTAVKIDPYLNVDAGTMNPVEHGEVFVTSDGMECDQDIGNYERFLNKDIPAINYMTSGSVYYTVIQRERNLGYGGRCVEVVPDIPEEVIGRLQRVAKVSKADFVLVEIGGTVGEYQNLLFLEAARMMRLRTPKQVIFALVSYLPVPKMVGEMKTKPTQYAVRSLNSAGIQPDLIIARSECPIDEPRKKKLSVFCNVGPEDIISAPDIQSSIYEIPVNFENDGLGKRIVVKFGMRDKAVELKQWKSVVSKIQAQNPEVKIGVVGKYFESGNFVLSDSYLSVLEAVKHAAWYQNRIPIIQWLNAGDYDPSANSTLSTSSGQGIKKQLAQLREFDGIIVPGGFGSRGVEGKINVIRYCRENNIPYFGLCYGMQLATIEFARNVCGMEGANTTEIDGKTPYPVIDIMTEQKAKLAKGDYGASMRLGAYGCALKEGTYAYQAYAQEGRTLRGGSDPPILSMGKKNGELLISERHRHRYELNNAYREQFTANGLVFSGVNPERDLVEIIELPKHKFFMGTQFHPELQSRPLRPHPLFVAFIGAAVNINE